ncbi:MAG TPA: hypothetical protein ENJ27_00760 [Candidatus Moranbacteria bacterium]|nr:hypothetical protein [Candidatus Moranbacteria bacterium]
MKKITKEFLQGASKKELADLKWLLAHPDFKERPVNIETFVNDPNYLGLKFYLKGNKGFGCRPRILKRLIDIFDSGKKYEEFVLMCGIGWGKDFTASIVLSYGLYKLACLKDPQSYYGLSKGTAIHLMLMSINEKHARDVLFGEVGARIDNSPWFQNNFKYDPNIKTEMRFSNNIYLIPGNSKDTTFVGYNIFMGIIDEADDYTVTEERSDAVEGYNSIKDRIVSRFRDKGMLGIIGSPKTVNGFMMSMYDNAEGVRNRYRVWVPTWDSLLDTGILSGKTFKYRDIEIPIEYEERFKSNGERAYRDLGARPSLAKEPYITLVDKIDNIFTDDEPFVNFKKDDVSFESFKNGIRGEFGVNYYGHLDLALNRKNGDRLGFSIGHPERFVEIDSENKALIKIDLAMAITAPPGGEIQFSHIKDIIGYLVEKGFKFVLFTADSWNSADMIQSIKKMGINSEVLSVDRTINPYEELKKSMYENRLKCHKNKLLRKELRSLELIDGKKVDHPAKGSKDIADAVAGVVYNIYKNESNKIINYYPSLGGNRVFK